ncbi:hypothetical protein QOZ80_7BG0612490 [Eleusine coracana subsp. coracana]|nr:hypothetical protein QOZ80_7BG0612490 [Eleusine coracana subsp. coracana]
MAAPFYKSIPIALLVVFATVVLPNLHQSAAIRAEGAEKAVAATTAPSPRGAPIHLKGGSFADEFPCFSSLPKVIRDLCQILFPPTPPETTECRSALKEKLVSRKHCTGFLTRSSVHKPPEECCTDLFNLMAADGGTSPYCICHVANGNIGQLLSKPLNRTRAVTVLDDCYIMLPGQTQSVADICIKHVEDYPVPPMDAPTAPPPAPEKKA